MVQNELHKTNNIVLNGIEQYVKYSTNRLYLVFERIRKQKNSISTKPLPKKIVIAPKRLTFLRQSKKFPKKIVIKQKYRAQVYQSKKPHLKM